MPEKCPICGEEVCQHTETEKEFIRQRDKIVMLEGAIVGWRKQYAAAEARIAELEAKNAKLLEALDWIANHPGYASLDRDFGPFKKDIIDDRNERILKARAALDGAGRE